MKTILFFTSVIALQGATLTILNPGFESPALVDHDYTGGAPGWTHVGIAGVYNPPASQFPSIPEGNNVGYTSDNINTSPAELSQVLSSALSADTTYTLQVYVGFRNLSGLIFVPPTISLHAGSTQLASIVSSTPDPGQFLLQTLTYTSPGSSPLIGQPLRISLLTTGKGQANYDSVSLTTSSPVPEPAAGLLVGAGLLGLARLRRRE